MKKLWIYLLLLCILNSIVLFDQSFGINIIIFTIPLNGKNWLKNPKNF